MASDFINEHAYEAMKRDDYDGLLEARGAAAITVWSNSAEIEVTPCANAHCLSEPLVVRI